MAYSRVIAGAVLARTRLRRAAAVAAADQTCIAYESAMETDSRVGGGGGGAGGDES